MDEQEKTFADPILETIRKIQTKISSYSVSDIAETLFISSLWLPNISSWLKHQIMVAAFISTNPQVFSKSNKITTYDDFKALVEKIYPLVPSMSSLEDYVPELDWGDIRYFFGERSYKIFYGCNIEAIHDFLYTFDLILASHDDVVQSIISRSPRTELITCLELQNTIISFVEHQVDEIDFEKIDPGHIEVPPKSFWLDARTYYNAFDSIDFVPEEVFENYSIALGSDAFVSRLGKNSIIDLASTGELIDVFFVEYEGRYYSVLPRMFSEVLIHQWAKIFAENKDKLLNEINYQKKLTLDILVYVSQRHKEDKILSLPSPVSSEYKPEDPVFACGFISRDKLFLIYVAQPFVDEETTQTELEALTTELHQAIQFITRSPTTLALHMDRKHVVFSPERGGTLKPEIIIVLPSVSIDGVAITVPEDLPATMIFMHDFLGLFDEFDDLSTLSDFFDFLSANDSTLTPFSSFVDKYGAFRDMHGVLVPGAQEANLIMLDPHWGSYRRYETLKMFWQLFPARVGKYLGHPRSWSVEMVAGKRANLVSRQYIGRILLCNIGNTLVLVNSPLHLVSPNIARLADLLTEAIEDSLTLNADVLSEHSFFQNSYILQISIYPSELILKNDEYQNLRDLIPFGKRWNLDSGPLGIRTRGIRIVIDETLITQAFIDSTDRTLEAELLSSIMTEIDKFIASPRVNAILAQIKVFAGNEPRYKMHQFEKMASFPEYVSPSKPDESHRKAAGKLVAQIALNVGMLPGEYELKDAEKHLNNLRKALVAIIDDFARKYLYRDTVQFLIGKTDALIDENFRSYKSIEGSLVHEVEFDRAESSANREIEFQSRHKSYQYLIEKFVELTPNGTQLIQVQQFQYLIALVDRLLQVYQASDSIHYGSYPVTLNVDEEFIISVIYKADIDDMQQLYHQEMANIELGLTGNNLDNIHLVSLLPEFVKHLDKAFSKNLGFQFTTMLSVLKCFSLWADLKSSKAKEATFYSATLDELVGILEVDIENTDQAEITAVLDFLVLSPDQMLVIYDQPSLSDDLPVWEHFKRPQRYSIRPLILVEDKYYWGAYSTRRAMMIWMSAIESGKLPFDIQEGEIKAIFDEEKIKIESAIVAKTAEILFDFTPNVEKEVYLHKRDREGKHPQNLGDYDVLAYIPEHNLLLNIECKDILPAFCMKDDSRIRRKYFGDANAEDRGFLGRVEIRQDYLRQNSQVVMKMLGWKSIDAEAPKVISIFVSRRSFWWTRFPPIETDVRFLTLDTLRDFLKSSIGEV